VKLKIGLSLLTLLALLLVLFIRDTRKFPPLPPLARQIAGNGMHRPRFLWLIPYGSARFVMPIDDADPIGSTIECMNEVHARGGGECLIPAHSLHDGKHPLSALTWKYHDTAVGIRQPGSAPK